MPTPTKNTEDKLHKVFHKNGSLWAKGQMKDGQPEGYWEWYRLDGTKMRSGYFDKGKVIGKWTTYDKSGNPYKITDTDKKPT